MDNFPDLPLRKDIITSEVIEAALYVLPKIGPREVAQNLEKYGVSFSTIVRVLMEPARRRKCSY